MCLQHNQETKGIGDYIFINQNGYSIIDYYIATRSLLDYITNFEILLQPESSHLP